MTNNNNNTKKQSRHPHLQGGPTDIFEDMVDSTSPGSEAKSKDANIGLAADLDNSLLGSINSVLETSEPANIDIKQFFKFLNLGGINQEAYKHITLDEETATRMRNHMISMKHGTYAAVPLICQGHEKCPIIHHCWFAKRHRTGEIDVVNSKFPMLQPCPVESSVIQLKVQQYVSQFVGDLNISVTPTTLALITKLAEIDIYEIRCDMILSGGDVNGEGTNLLVKTVEAINENTGDVIHGVKEHPILAVKDRLQKQRDKLLSQLVATPEALINAQHKLGNNNDNDVASQLTQLNNTLQDMKRLQSGTPIEDHDVNSQYGNPNLRYIDVDADE